MTLTTIGKPTTLVGAFEKVWERTIYAADFFLPGTIWGKGLLEKGLA